MKKILVIDDDEAVREELRDRIELMGHEVEEASCAEHALKLVKDVAFDCILLDLSIPNKYQGVSQVHHGRNLLQRFRTVPGIAPILVITAHGLDDWQMAADMHDLGAFSFIGKPFTDKRVDDRIASALAASRKNGDSGYTPDQEFKGGELVMYGDRIELCGEEVGGVRGNSLIRQILPLLARKTEKGSYLKPSRKDLASEIGSQTSEGVIASAIKDFRTKCTTQLGCDKHDVIITHRGGGYQMADWIVFKLGSEETIGTQADKDKSTVLREIRKFKKRTTRQIYERTDLTMDRVKTALSKLDDEGVITLKGVGSNAAWSLKPAD